MTQKSAPRPARAEASAFQITYFWDKIISVDLNLGYKYFELNSCKVSSHAMMHLLGAYKDGEKPVEHILSQSEQKEFISSFYSWMKVGGVLRADNIPGVSFRGSKIKVFCQDSETLVESFYILNSPKMQFSKFYTAFEAKGFPFKPKQWTLRSLPADPNEERLVANIKSYLGNNKESLGENRAVWAKFSKISSIEGRCFAGTLVLLNDATTISDKRPAAPFVGVEPEDRPYSYYS